MHLSRSFTTRCVEALLGAALTATIVSQHPLRSFDRMRRLDRTNLLLPDWRLFAPTPVMHDFHLLYRCFEGDREGEWEVASRIAERKLSQLFWHPERRRDKIFFDLCQQMSFSALGNPATARDTSVYRILRDYIAICSITDNPQRDGFQFMVIRTGGHDGSESPLSTYISPVEAADPSPSAAGRGRRVGLYAGAGAAFPETAADQRG